MVGYGNYETQIFLPQVWVGVLIKWVKGAPEAPAVRHLLFTRQLLSTPCIHDNQQKPTLNTELKLIFK